MTTPNRISALEVYYAAQRTAIGLGLDDLIDQVGQSFSRRRKETQDSDAA
jgi:hypothetical protein